MGCSLYFRDTDVIELDHRVPTTGLAALEEKLVEQSGSESLARILIELGQLPDEEMTPKLADGA